jgi:spore photoproduct lyase
VLFTPEALALPWGERIHERVVALGLPVERLRSNRLVGLRGKDERETYRLAKRTLSVVTAPPGQLRLQPIPPSADWQFHLAQGCPAHCQYCYLAGSLQGPPTVRVYANLPEILANLAAYEQPGRITTFEASCYTDPLSLEHLTGSLAETIRYFGTRPGAGLRWVTKFASVEPLVGLAHEGRTRARFSVNAAPVSRRWEGGTAPVAARLAAAATLARDGGYPIGLVVAPIVALDDWQTHYAALLDEAAAALPEGCDLTFELITHRFTPGSRDVLAGWYPNSTLEMDPAARSEKRNKFGGVKYVYPRDTMRALRDWFDAAIAERFPRARVLYWT